MKPFKFEVGEIVNWKGDPFEILGIKWHSGAARVTYKLQGNGIVWDGIDEEFLEKIRKPKFKIGDRVKYSGINNYHIVCNIEDCGDHYYYVINGYTSNQTDQRVHEIYLEKAEEEQKPKNDACPFEVGEEVWIKGYIKERTYCPIIDCDDEICISPDSSGRLYYAHKDRVYKTAGGIDISNQNAHPQIAKSFHIIYKPEF